MSLHILFSSSVEDNLALILDQNISALERAIGELYDDVWPQWCSLRSIQISVQLLDELEMAEINKRYRDVEGPTDVLTFPLCEQDGKFLPDMKAQLLMLGDILLCPEVVRRNATEHGCPDYSELFLVLFHGSLHLLAWDHDTPEREKKMWDVQQRCRDRFLSHLKLKREG